MGMELRRFWSRSRFQVVASAAALAAVFPGISLAQSPGDLIRIGSSPAQWNQFESYWNQLINLNGSKTTAAEDPQSGSSTQTAVDPQILQKGLIRNLRISGLRLAPIIKLNGSSQLTGSITNGNRKAVTVASINFAIYDGSGNLIQTSSATPEPSTIAPGATVTFQRELPTVPPNPGYSIRLVNPAVTLQGGV